MHWRYHLLGTPRGAEPRDSWSIVFVDDDGCLSILSDYGNWGYRWNMAGESKSVRRMLLDFNSSYVYNKLSYDHAKVFSPEKTIKVIREQILSYRRQRELPKKEASVDWHAVGRVNNVLDFQEFLDNQRGRWNRYVDMAMYEPHNASGLDHWTKVSFPRLQERIREQLADEATKANLPS